MFNSTEQDTNAERVLIRTHTMNSCPACSDSGHLLYTNLHDRLFPTHGTYDMRRCKNKKCETQWIDPRPILEDLHKLYAKYSTHTTLQKEHLSEKRSILARIRESYLFYQYGYVCKSPSRILSLIAYLHPVWRDMCAMSIFYFPYKKDGLFLDVGCGSGAALSTMCTRGWNVRGIDFDQQAVETARVSDFVVDSGTLIERHYPEGSFDAVLLSNVIEHVPNPKEIVRECYRILNQKGVLVIITPNAESFGQKIFGKNWRGLETPQHLQIFTPKSLSFLAYNAGFKKIKSETSPHSDVYILEQSRALTKKDSIAYNKPFVFASNKIVRHILNLIFGYLNALFNRSEAVVVIAQKQFLPNKSSQHFPHIHTTEETPLP